MVEDGYPCATKAGGARAAGFRNRAVQVTVRAMRDLVLVGGGSTDLGTGRPASGVVKRGTE